MSTGKGLCLVWTSLCCHVRGQMRCPLWCCTARLRLRVVLSQSRYYLPSQWPKCRKKTVKCWSWSSNCFLLLCFSQGVYRVSGSKPRIQKLCQAFETQKEKVDLSDHSPNDITSILKHFFKEVQESLPNELH